VLVFIFARKPTVTAVFGLSTFSLPLAGEVKNSRSAVKNAKNAVNLLTPIEGGA